MDLQHLRILPLSRNLIGFYDGRVPGQRFSAQANWVDDGALSLGICSYALIDGDEALVYDTHVSLDHAGAVRRELERRGVRRIVVVLSHWHLDHVAGSAAFAGLGARRSHARLSGNDEVAWRHCEIVATRMTRDRLTAQRAAIEAGTSADGPPAVSPLVLPTTVIDGATRLRVGRLRVTALPMDIHTADGLVLHLPDEGMLLAGDTVEDTVTYVSEPESLETHLRELERLRGLQAAAIYPNHGDPDVLAAGGYGEGLIRATQRYTRDLLRVAGDPAPADLDLRTFVADSLEAGWIRYFAPYERVHRANLEEVARAAG